MYTGNLWIDLNGYFVHWTHFTAVIETYSCHILGHENLSIVSCVICLSLTTNMLDNKI